MAEVMKYDDFKELGSETAVKAIHSFRVWLILLECRQVQTRRKTIYRSRRRYHFLQVQRWSRSLEEEVDVCNSVVGLIIRDFRLVFCFLIGCWLRW